MPFSNKNLLSYVLLSIPTVLCGIFIAGDLTRNAILTLFLYSWILLAAKNVHMATAIILLLIPFERNNLVFSREEIILLKGVLVFFLFCVWFIKRFAKARKMQEVFSDNAFNPFWVLFLSFVVLSTANSIDLAGSFQYLLLATSTCFLFFIFTDGLKNLRMIQISLWILIATSFLVALVAVLQYVIIRFHVFLSLERFLVPQRLQFQNILFSLYEVSKHRTYGTFSHPNLLGAYFALCIPISFVFFLLQEKTYLRSLVFCSWMLSMIALVLSNSRSAILSTMMSLLYICFFVLKQKKKIFFFVMTLTTVVALLIMKQSAIWDSLLNYFRFQDKLSNRNVLWANTVPIISGNKLLGTGPATFSKVYHSLNGMPAGDSPELLVEDIYESQRTGKAVHQPQLTAHNVFFQYMTCMGCMAPLFIILFYYLYYKQIRALFSKKAQVKFYRYLLLGTSAAVGGTLFHGLFESTVFMDQQFQSYLFVYLVGLTIACHQNLFDRPLTESGEKFA